MRAKVFHEYTYEEYLRLDIWLSRKAEAIRRAGYKCEQCGSMIKLNVHHKSYQRLGNESKEDLVVLCEEHHKAIHEKGIKLEKKSKY